MIKRLGVALLLLAPVTASAQDHRDESMYFPGAFYWQFLKRYPDAARLFNAFDYGHAALYERLLTLPRPQASVALASNFFAALRRPSSGWLNRTCRWVASSSAGQTL